MDVQVVEFCNIWLTIINSTNEYCHEPDAVLNTFCVTRFCCPEIFQFFKENVLSIMFN